MMNAMDIVALDIHRNSPDLGTLSQLAHRLRFIPIREAEQAEGVLIAPGIWATDSSADSSLVLKSRYALGRHTILVPRFRAGQLTSVLGTPSSVEVVSAEFKSFECGPEHYGIPGFTVFRTALHAGKLGEAPGVGTVLLMFRPTTTSGAVVLCSAMAANRVVGVSPAVQERLLAHILAAIEAPVAKPQSIEEEPVSLPSNVDEFLQQERENGAAYLLCQCLVADAATVDFGEVAREKLGISLPTEAIIRLKSRLPAANPEELRSSLRRFGWGSYLRRLESDAAEKPE